MSTIPTSEIANVHRILDLTSLNIADTPDTIAHLCAMAKSAAAPIAAICVYPKFITLVNNQLAGTPTRTAIVANFPNGDENLTSVQVTIEQAINDGAHEIDLVMPYQAFLAGNYTYVSQFITACKRLCPKQVLLKVILETGALQTEQNITAACMLAIESGAHFLKTSTGKISIGATLETAAIMLNIIKKMQRQGNNIGFKASGGIRTINQAQSYMNLAAQILGPDWVKPENFRIGTSKLLLD